MGCVLSFLWVFKRKVITKLPFSLTVYAYGGFVSDVSVFCFCIVFLYHKSWDVIGCATVTVTSWFSRTQGQKNVSEKR